MNLRLQHQSGNGTWWAWYEGTYQRGRYIDDVFVEEDLLIDEGL